MIVLRDYQQQALDDVRAKYRSGIKRVILTMPTGSGKTATATKLAQMSTRKGKSVLFVAHRRELVEQLSEALWAWGVPHGVILPGAKQEQESVQVASLGSLVRRSIPQVDMIVIDECHHAVDGSMYGRVVEANPMAFLLGLTATPCRLDGRGLSDYFDIIVEGPDINYLIDSGYLVKPVIYSHSLPDLGKVKTIGGDYAKEASAEAMSGAIVGDAIREFATRGQRPAISFSPTVKHAEQTAERFRQHGYSAEALSGNTSAENRRDILRRLEAGHLDVLASCDVVSEGTDIPVVGTAILLRPTQSFVVYRQQVGRALRPAAGKDRAIILDHAGNAIKHGLPTDETEWTLEGRKKSKRSDSAGKRCSECFAISSAGASVCIDCGKPFVVKSRRDLLLVDGELHELTRLPVMHDRAKAKTLEELRAIERSRGYKRGWANHVWNARMTRRRSS